MIRHPSVILSGRRAVRMSDDTRPAETYTVFWPEHSHVHVQPGSDPEDVSHFIDPQTIVFPNDDFVSDEAVTLEEMKRQGAL